MPSTGPDPLLKSGRREALLALLVWGVALLYTVGYCYRFGYGPQAASNRFILGVPHWVFWGVVVPWLACLIFCGWFSFFFMTEDELPSESPSSPPNDSAR